MKAKGFIFPAVLLGIALILSGCQGVFTTSLLKGLQRDPANLSDEQKIAWAEEALASGDLEAMAAAYAAIKPLAADSDDGYLNYLAANLALELSGVPALLTGAMNGEIDLSSKEDMQEFMDGIDTSYSTDASDFFQTANESGTVELTSTDYLLGATCILFAAAEDNGGKIEGAYTTDAVNFVNDGIAQIQADNPDYENDPAYQMLDSFLDMLTGL